MKDTSDGVNIERQIDEAIIGFCLLCVVGLGTLFDSLASGRFAAHWMIYLVVFAIAIGLSNILSRVRPDSEHAGRGWLKFYSFLLAQMDIHNAFKRKKDTQPSASPLPHVQDGHSEGER